MLTITHHKVDGFWWAMHGARQSYNSHDKSDTEMFSNKLGENDLALLKKLASAGDDHGKCMRYIVVYVDVTAPLLWWKQEATYKVGTTENSTSTMHTITKKPFAVTDFSNETSLKLGSKHWESVISDLNAVRDLYVNYDQHKESLEKHGISKEDLEKSLYEMLPDSYLQTRTMVLNYQVLKHMYHARKHHKLGEWHQFCEFIRSLPYAEELIVGE